MNKKKGYGILKRLLAASMCLILAAPAQAAAAEPDGSENENIVSGTAAENEKDTGSSVSGSSGISVDSGGPADDGSPAEAGDAENIETIETIETAEDPEPPVEEPGTILAAAEHAGEGKYVIAPIRVSYEAGATVWEAVSAAPDHLISLDSENHIIAVDEVRGDYRLITSEGSVSLDAKASEVNGWLLFTTAADESLGSGKQILLNALLAYQDNPRAARDQQCVQDYEAALNGGGLSDEEAAALGGRLQESVDTVEDRLGAEGWDGVSQVEPETDENGTYLIGTGAELAWFAGLVNGTLEGVEQNRSANALLTADINLSGYQWTPIGRITPDGDETIYEGTFDGQGHRIDHLYIDLEYDVGEQTGWSRVAGFFGRSSGVIQNFTLSGSVTVKGKGGYYYVAGVVGIGETIRNVHNECDVTVVCTNEESIGANVGYIASIAGSAETIENCSNKGDVRYEGAMVGATAAGIGGIVRQVRNCVNEGDVTMMLTGAAGGVRSDVASGVTGQCHNFSVIENCYNLGKITAKQYVYGIGSAGTMRNCYNAGELVQTGDPNDYTSGGVNGSRPYGITIYPIRNTLGVDCSYPENCCYLELEQELANAIGTSMAREELLQAAGFLGDAFVFNGKSGYHEGYPVLRWETETEAYQNQPREPITAVTLLEGAAETLSVAPGTEETEIPGLWRELEVTVSGVTFQMPAEPVCAEGFRPDASGYYTFTYVLDFSDYPGIYLPEEVVALPRVRVRVRDADEPEPLIREFRWGDGRYSIAWGGDWAKTLPRTVSARIEEEGESRWVLLPLSWQEPEGYTSTPEEGTEYVFTSLLPAGYELGLGVDAPEAVLTVKALGYLTGLSLSGAYHLSPSAFDGSVHEYTVEVPDSVGSLKVCAVMNPVLPEGSTAKWQELDEESWWALRSGVYANVSIRKDPEKIYPEPDGTVNVGMFPRDTTAEITVTNGETGETQVYVIHIKRVHTLRTLTVTADGSSAEISPAFSPEEQEYTALVPDTAEYVTVSGAPRYSCTVSVNGGGAEENVRLDGDETEITLLVTHTYTGDSSVYTVTVKKQKTVRVEARVTPEEAGLSIRNSGGEGVYPDGDGMYHLMEGKRYSYSATCLGYISTAGRFTASEGLVLTVSMTKALDNPDLVQDLPAQWENFRGNSDNNGVTETETPRDADEAELYWASKLGEGFGSEATGSPIIVDDALIFTAGRYIYRMDRFTGEVLAQTQMCGKSAYNLIPPTYGDGMIFVGLAGGAVQAFNAATLKSLWVYENAWGGQPNCPITYQDGYIYTGFWNWDYEEAQFVCVPVTDEYPLQTMERKTEAWAYTYRGGFYWAGAYAGDGYVLVGTDDGQSGTAPTGQVLSFDSRTGRLLDSLTGLNGDVRCTIVHDPATGRCYFDTTGGTFYGVRVDESGHFVEGSLQTLDLGAGEALIGSTSTPVVYNGRAYIGVRGENQFEPYGGHTIAVIDLSEEGLSIAYTCNTGGYCQSSGLLSIGYTEDEDGWVYVYFIENYYPGKVRVVKDRKGETGLANAVTETYTYQGINHTAENCAPVLFTPQGGQRAFAIGSAIVDEYGTLYFKNDSAYMMAVGSRVERIEVTEQPDKTAYAAGESFDPSGMKVVAHLSNGLTRDVTDRVTWSEEGLSASDGEVLIYYTDVLYHDSTTATGDNRTGVVSDPLWDWVDITVQGETVLGDVDGDGVTDGRDITALSRYLDAWENQGWNVSGAVADLNGDGVVDSRDVTLYRRFLDDYYEGAYGTLEELKAAQAAAG